MAIAIFFILAFSIFPSVLLAAPQCDDQADIVLILDSSESVKKSNYDKLLDFIVNYTRNFDVETKVQFGAIVFSDDAKTVFDLNAFSDHASLEMAIMGIGYKSGGTNTDKALKLARTSSFTAAGGAREGVPKVVIVFTDGQSKKASDTQAQATALKDAGVNVISVGIDHSCNQTELALIASSPQDVLEVPEFDELDTINRQLTDKTCDLVKVKETCSCADITSSLDQKLNIVEEKLASVEEKMETITMVKQPDTPKTPCTKVIKALFGSFTVPCAS